MSSVEESGGLRFVRKALEDRPSRGFRLLQRHAEELLVAVRLGLNRLELLGALLELVALG